MFGGQNSITFAKNWEKALQELKKEKVQLFMVNLKSLLKHHPSPKKTQKQLHGTFGEVTAMHYLVDHGYEILARNVRVGYGEIDIVARQDRTLVIVEVRTRYSDAFGPPEESITPFKLKTLIRSSALYEHQLDERYEGMRIDLVAITMHGNKVANITHIKDITS